MDARFGFEWDENKNQRNHEKHGIPFEYAANVFLDEDRIEAPSRYRKEQRYSAIGRTLRGEILYVVFTWRTHHEKEQTNRRIISARKAGAKERSRYSGIQ